MTNSKRATDQSWNAAWAHIQTVVDTMCEPFMILDKNMRVISANREFYTFFRTDAKDTEGQIVYSLGKGQWDIPRLHLLLEDVLPEKSFFEGFRVEHDFPAIGSKIMTVNARCIRPDTYADPLLLLAMRDISHQLQLEERLKTHAQELSREVTRRTAKLEIQIIELERLNTLMLDREMKMIELKAELRRLKAFHGERHHAKAQIAA